jgi:hypothetical protein
MDLSKLPRMSETPPPPPPQTPQDEQRATRGVAAAPVDYGAYEPAPSLAEAWISIAIGLILLFATYALRPLQYLLAPASFTWTFNDATGAPLKYTQTVFFWGDIAMLLFAIVLIVEGLLLFTRRPMLIMLAFGITVLTVAANLIYVAGMMTRGYGFQLPSAIAVAFGVYIALFQWKLIQSMRALRPRGVM